MSESIELLNQALMLATVLSITPLLISMVVGLISAVFQAATQIQDPTLSFVPKVVAVTLLIYFFYPWMMESYYSFVMDTLVQ